MFYIATAYLARKLIKH